MKVLFSTLCVGLSMFATLANAQVVGVGTTNGGAVAQVGASVATVVSSATDMQMRPAKMSGTQQYMDAVNGGTLEFGVSNAMQYYMGVSGTGLSEGSPRSNLQLVATLMPFVQGVIVRKDSGITSIAELKGKRVPAGYASSPLFVTFWEAFLANEGISYEDVQQVPVASLPKSWNAFKEGQIDAVIAATGSAAVREMDAVIDGGVRYLPITETPELLKMLPRTRIEIVEPNPDLNGVVEPTPMHVYEVVLFAGKDVGNDIVGKVAKAIEEGEEALRQSSALWNKYRSKNIAMDHDMEYHAGAKAHYEASGTWQR